MELYVSCVAIALCAILFMTTVTASGSNRHNNIAHNYDGDDNDDVLIGRPSITLVINDDRFDITVFSRYNARLLSYPESIKRARIENAPSGYGCFFWSPIGSVMSSIEGITFVSKTFYSGTDEYTYFDFLMNPEYLVCFKLPELDEDDDAVVVWAESSSTDTDNLRTAMGFITLSSHDDGTRSGHFFLPGWPSLDRVAIVYALNPETACIAGGGPGIIEGTGPLETIYFSMQQPSIEQLLSPVSVICYA